MRKDAGGAGSLGNISEVWLRPVTPVLERHGTERSATLKAERLMPSQPHLFPEPVAPEPVAPEPTSASASTRSGRDPAAPETIRTGGTAPVWLQRMSLFILVLFCVYLGVLVTVLPWWGRLWEHNSWIQARPALAAVLGNGAVRGLISGLGLLDIWIGISEAVHYRDYRG